MTDDPEFEDLPTRTDELFDDLMLRLWQWGTLQPKQDIFGNRIGWQTDIWEHDGDAVWRVTVEAVGS